MKAPTIHGGDEIGHERGNLTLTCNAYSISAPASFELKSKEKFKYIYLSAPRKKRGSLEFVKI
jgi:hypothetical protein